MQTTSPPPRPALPKRLLDDAWWLAAVLTDRPARVIPFPAHQPTPPRSGGAKR